MSETTFKKKLLIIDSKVNFQEALKIICDPYFNNIFIAQNWNNAMEILKKEDIHLIILDMISLPGYSGFDCLKDILDIKNTVEIINITNNPTIKSTLMSIHYNINDYIIKPFKIEKLILTLEKVVKKVHFNSQIKLLTESSQEQNFEETKKIINNLKDYFENKSIVNPWEKIKEIVKTLSLMIKNKDPYTESHSIRVLHYAMIIANEINLNQAEKNDLEVGVYLHDIGMMQIDKNILEKQGKYDSQEIITVKKHPELGANIATLLGFPISIINIIHFHHEFFNGLGYPKKLAGNNIPLLARIVCIADSFDSMITPRSYKMHLPLPEAKNELIKCRNLQFSPEITDIFIKIINTKGEEIIFKENPTA